MCFMFASIYLWMSCYVMFFFFLGMFHVFYVFYLFPNSFCFVLSLFLHSIVCCADFGCCAVICRDLLYASLALLESRFCPS